MSESFWDGRVCFVVIAAMMFGCSGSTQDLGGGGADGGASGQSCSCAPSEGCCGPNLICDPCRVLGGGGLSCGTVNGVADRQCRPPRPPGTICTEAAQCGPGSECKVDPSSGDPRSACTAPGATLDGRCRESLDCKNNTVCVDSYCKLARGERCEASKDCASNKCYGTSPLDYRCL